MNIKEEMHRFLDKDRKIEAQGEPIKNLHKQIKELEESKSKNLGVSTVAWPSIVDQDRVLPLLRDHKMDCEQFECNCYSIKA